MDQTSYQQWWQLHLRVARGEPLSADKQAFYEDGLRQIDADERLASADTTQLRGELHQLEKRFAVLESQRRALDLEIQQLETRLNNQGVEF